MRAIVLVVLFAAPAMAQQQAARQAAPIDITGQWVAFVTEDWRFRMMTPPKGDYTRVPLTPEGRKAADAWNPAADQAAGNACKAYGVGGIMRIPGRLRISWQDDMTLRIESDAGMQTRTLRFAASAPSAAPTWQGDSRARWDVANRSLRVSTTNFRSGYLRRNGVPYSENAAITEYFDRFAAPDGAEWLVVTTIVTDPKYLNQDFVTSSHFKREADGSRWQPSPCRTT